MRLVCREKIGGHTFSCYSCWHDQYVQHANIASVLRSCGLIYDNAICVFIRDIQPHFCLLFRYLVLDILIQEILLNIASGRLKLDHGSDDGRPEGNIVRAWLILSGSSAPLESGTFKTSS